MSIRIKGEALIFKNEKGLYSTGISNKLQDGTYENSYIGVQFKKGVELENKTRITIDDAFLSFYKNQEGKPIFKIVVLDFTQYGDVKEEEFATSQAADSSLPF